MNHRESKSSFQTVTRRQFLGATMVTSFALPALAGGNENDTPLRIGLIADVHKDIIHDADQRLEAFVNTMADAKVDAIVQLGDFCIPKSSNDHFLSIFNRFDGPRYHVLGNHDTDGGFHCSDTVKFYGMPSRYYSFDMDRFHFVVLDANDRPSGDTTAYPSHIAAEQREWLKGDLAGTDRTVFVFVHQSLERPFGIWDSAAVREILEEAHLPDGSRKVAAVFNGHHHIDHAREINDIPYIHINSASYYWLGGKEFQHKSYSDEIHKEHPSICNTSPYQDPLYTMLTIDPGQGVFSLTASATQWQGASPKQLGLERGGLVADGMVAPRISARSISMK